MRLLPPMPEMDKDELFLAAVLGSDYYPSESYLEKLEKWEEENKE